MGRNIYPTKTSKLDEFTDYDGISWFKAVSDEEFEKSKAAGRIFEVDGWYFDAASAEDAEIAANRLKNPQAKQASSGNGTASSGGSFGNLGSLLKTAAIVLLILDIIGSLILAGHVYSGGFAIFIAGVILSVFTWLILTAFGDLVENVNEINRKIK